MKNLTRVLLLCSLPFVTGCAGTIRDLKADAKEIVRETLDQSKGVLVEVGHSLAVELKTAGAEAARAAIDAGKDALAASGGDLVAAGKAALGAIPGAAAEGAKSAALSAIEKRMEAAGESPERQAEFQRRALQDGLWQAILWAGGGSVLGAFTWLWRLFRKNKTALGIVSQAIDGLSVEHPAVANQIKDEVKMLGGMHPAIDKTIDLARAMKLP